MDFKYKIVVDTYSFEDGYTGWYVWERTNEELTAQEFIEKYGKELPPFSIDEDLEVSIYEDHFSWDQEKLERLPGGIRNKLLDRAWVSEVRAMHEC